jgi:hypothetical protein
MIDGELAPAAEQVAERACTLRSFEDIRPLDLDPRHLPALGAERVEFRARSLARSALRASSHFSRETMAWFMVNLLWLSVSRPPTGDWKRASARAGMEKAHQQVHRGHAMDRHAGTRGAERDRRSTFAAIHAISAKVGEAARASQPAAPRAWRPLRFLGLLLRTFSFSGPRSIVAIPSRCGVERGIYDEADAG